MTFAIVDVIFPATFYNGIPFGFRRLITHVTPHFAMLDAMTSFVLDDDGRISPIGGEQPDTKDGETWVIIRRKPKGWK